MTTRRTFVASLFGAAAFAVPTTRIAAQGGHDMHHGASTPESTPAACATPMAGHGDMANPSSSPMAMMDFDLAYIDMMIPHHESVIALAEVAKDELQDDRLVRIAEAIIATQPAEITQLRDLREQWYGSPDPAPMSEEIMNVSMGMSHGCVEQGHMDQMSSEWQLETFAAAEDKDLAFIDQVIPHHQMAVDTSEVALEQAEHEEIKEIARLVIEAQEREIAELEEIRAELTATPAA